VIFFMKKRKELNIIDFPNSLEECKIFIDELKAQQRELEWNNKELIIENKLLKDQLQENVNFQSKYSGRLTLSCEGIILEIDSSASIFLGRQIEQLKSKRFIDFLTVNSLPDFEDFMTNVFKFPTTVRREVTLNIPFNVPVTIQIEGILSSNRAECIVHKMADIFTPIKNSSHIPESDVNNQVLLRSLKEGVVIVNLNESIIYINPAGELILEGSDGEFKNRKLKELINSDQLRVIPDKTDYWEKEEEKSIEVEILTQKGENKILNISSLPYFDSKGVRCGTLLIFIDETEREKTNKLHQKYLTIQRDLGFELGVTTTIEQALIHVIHSMLQILEIHAVGIYLINPHKGKLELTKHEGFSPEFICSIQNSVKERVYSQSIYAGVPIYGLYNELFEGYETLKNKDLKQFGVIPIKHEGKIIGSAILASKASERFKYKSRYALEIIAAQIGGTLARINSEVALKLSEKNFQLIFDTINDFVFILDAEGKIISVNKDVEKGLGYTQEELQRMSILEVHTPEQHDKVVSFFNKILTGKLSICPVPLITKNGNLIPVETKIARGKWNEKDAIFCISRDITARQEAESKLKMQSLAFEASSLAIIITDIDGNIQWANSSFSRLSGYTMSEILGKNQGQLVKSGKQDRAFYQNMWNTILNGKIYSSELINKRKDGNIYPEELTITPILNPAGEITSFIAIMLDITIRKEMEVALKMSEERWHFALEVSGEGAWDWNLITNEIFFADQWKHMLGYSALEVENKLSEWKKLVHPDDIRMCLDNLNKYINGVVEIYHSEYRMRCKDENYIWILDRGKIVDLTTEGKPLRIIGTHKDITNQKLYEEQLEIGIVRERELNELKSSLIATTSHEFRTPLASILMISDTLISYNQKMNLNQILARIIKIKNHVLHLTDIVNHVLQLSKMQEGNVRFNPENVDIIAICIRITDGFNSGELQKDRIKFISSFKTLIVKVDKLLIIQSINNLMSNALKYSPENSLVNVELNLVKDELLFMVQDKGIGIPDKDLKHLFKPFYRASNTAAIQGDGLGLSIVRESLLLHGGTVSCSNNIIKGSTFILHFPLELISTYSFNPEN